MNNSVPINLDSLEETDQLLERHKLSKLMQREVDDLNRPGCIFKNWINNNFSKKKAWSPDDSAGKFY